jgi:hypothetical protein
MAFDYSKLKGRIIEKFGTQRDFAKAMGTSERTLSLKLNNMIFFRQDEIGKATDLLHLHAEDMNEYFFTPKVKEVKQKR